MTTPPDTPASAADDPVAQAAATWALRHDRGLTAAEQDEFSHWLGADPRHRNAWAEHRWGWEELDRLAGLQASVAAEPDPDLLRERGASRGRRTAWFLPALAALAAVFAVGIFVVREPETTEPAVPAETAGPRTLALIEQRELPDRSVVQLNRGAVVLEHFSTRERRVRLERGEAHFQVTKDPARPFFVEAGGVVVRAVGTAFNVKLEPASVEVLVTEGKVGVAEPRAQGGEGRRGNGGAVLLAAGERALVSRAASAPPAEVSTVSSTEMETRLAWQVRLLDFTEAPLAEIVAEFNRRNPVRLTLADPSLAGLRLSATFRSDNVEGFVRLMASDFDMRAQWRGEHEIVLGRAP